MKRFKIAVLTSGHSRGSNFKAIVDYIRMNDLPIDVAFLFAVDATAPVIQLCKEYNIPVILAKNTSRINDQLIEVFGIESVDLIVLAGFMRKINDSLLQSVKCPIINIHPALLPKFGGKGMFGMNVHQAVFDAKEQYSGATVHLVSNQYDEGDIIIQQSIEINDCKSPEEIAKHVLKIEHEIYPLAIKKILTI